ncbi:MAG TPA: hypothetical protein VMT03_22745 [Polyangia bacterium]|nr:hypothetical protein [Polyangia bacterium]
MFEQDEFDTFLLTDGSAEAILCAPFRLELAPYDARSENVPQKVFDLVRTAGANVTMFGMPDELRYVEVILEPDDEIVAVGLATVEISPEGRSSSLREPPVLCYLRGDKEPVVIADADDLSGGNLA